MARQYEVGDRVKLLINDGTSENPNNNYSRSMKKYLGIFDEDIYISLGSFTGISILSGRGIKVPIRISTSPSNNFVKIFFCSVGVTNLDIWAIFIGKDLNLSTQFS